LILSSKEY